MNSTTDSQNQGSLEDKNDYVFKLVLVGDSGVGKSCILHQFIYNRFRKNTTQTIGVDFSAKNVHIDNQEIKLQIWDTVGQEKFMAINKSLLAKVHGIILIYDITDQDSFDHINNWITIIKEANENASLILVANKCDIEDKRVISEDEGNKLAVENNISFVEASAKENINIKETFIKITEEVMNNVHRKSVHFNDNEILINAQKRQSFSYQKNKQSRKCLKCC